jgi:RNA recognition motif-containing protein
MQSVNGLDFMGRNMEVRLDRGRGGGNRGNTRRGGNSGGYNDNNGGYNNNNGGNHYNRNQGYNDNRNQGGYNDNGNDYGPPMSGNFTGTSIFVSNLSWGVNSEGLQSEFGAYNPVSASVATDFNTGRSRGWGTVKFSSPDAANQAIQAMEGASIDGRAIRTRLDRKA